MITLPDALRPEHVVLDLAATTPAAAIKTMSLPLRNDPRVIDWPGFVEALSQQPACRTADAGVGLYFAHARTTAVSDIVISAARLSPELPCAEIGSPVRYVFCIGVPQTMAADYLRLVGALMRIFKDPETEEALHTAATRQAFVEILGRLEIKL